ncbi:MAG TPA: hypothetical protein P5160_03665 [Candidatus Omnitrophota bacterium]|jgi:hypothetical protein|nr:hypothetical protein [Candidatus Omnitrophota bacterium]
MNIMNLKNNALFLSCWHERNRPVQLICFGIMILSVLFLGYLSVAMGYGYDRTPLKVFKDFFAVVIGLQALILLVQAPLFAWHMGSREKTSGTLDFHRSSPEDVFEKIFGLILGSTCVEWVLCACFFALEILFTLHPEIPFESVLLFNLSLIASGIFLHTACVTLGMLSSSKKRGVSGLGLLIFIWFLGPAVFGVMSWAPSFMTYLFGLSGFKYLFPDSFEQVSGHFFTFTLPVIALQALIQAPLTLLFGNGMLRMFSKPNSPAWSKEDILRFCFFILFLTTGFFIAEYTHLSEETMSSYYYWSYNYYANPVEQFIQSHVWRFVISYVLMGVVMSAFFVPTYFKSSKYEVLKRLGKIKTSHVFDDGYSGWCAVLAYSVSGVLLFSFYLAALDYFSLQAVGGCLLVISYAVGFAGFLEFFRLSRFRQNKIFFVTVMMSWWAFIPWIIALMFSLHGGDHISVLSMTPFVGVRHGVSLILNEIRVISMETILTPWIIAFLMWVLAVKERQALEVKVERTLKADNRP